MFVNCGIIINHIGKMSSKEVILGAVNSLPLGREFMRNDFFQLVNELVKSSTFSFFFNKVLVGKRFEVVGKQSGSRILLYKRKY